MLGEYFSGSFLLRVAIALSKGTNQEETNIDNTGVYSRGSQILKTYQVVVSIRTRV